MSKQAGGKAVFAFAILLAALPASAQGVLDAVIDGETFRADIAVGDVAATLTIRFENVVGLSADGLNVSARTADPLTLAPRLGGASLPAAFPLVVRIEPPASGGLSFSGVVSIELYTHDLQYTVGSPLRLYSAPLGGEFTDITTSLGSGSVRTGGSKPDFSEFLIAADLRPLGTVIDLKYAQLGDALTRHAGAISADVLAELHGLRNASLQSYRQGAHAAAITYIEAFAEKVKAASGRDIPDVWRSSRDLTNAAGVLRSAAATLRFSLTLASNAS